MTECRVCGAYVEDIDSHFAIDCIKYLKVQNQIYETVLRDVFGLIEKYDDLFWRGIDARADFSKIKSRMEEIL